METIFKYFREGYKIKLIIGDKDKLVFTQENKEDIIAESVRQYCRWGYFIDHKKREVIVG